MIARLPLFLSAVICSASAAATTPCPTTSAIPNDVRPVLSDDAHLGNTFGPRRHPLLGDIRHHTGVDWIAPIGTPVVAAASGRVAVAARDGQFGLIVVIAHSDTLQTLYAHLARFTVTPDTCVEAGTVIGAVGNTGLVTGPQLHFEVHQSGRPVDPLSVDRGG